MIWYLYRQGALVVIDRPMVSGTVVTFVSGGLKATSQWVWAFKDGDSTGIWSQDFFDKYAKNVDVPE